MQKIIDEVLEAESSAAALVEDARVNAAKIRAQSEQDAAAIIQAARLQAQKALQDSLLAAQTESKDAYDAALRKIEDENGDFIAKHSERIAATVNDIVELIRRTEQERPKHP